MKETKENRLNFKNKITINWRKIRNITLWLCLIIFCFFIYCWTNNSIGAVSIFLFVVLIYFTYKVYKKSNLKKAILMFIFGFVGGQILATIGVFISTLIWPNYVNEFWDSGWTLFLLIIGNLTSIVWVCRLLVDDID